MQEKLHKTGERLEQTPQKSLTCVTVNNNFIRRCQQWAAVNGGTFSTKM